MIDIIMMIIEIMMIIIIIITVRIIITVIKIKKWPTGMFVSDQHRDSRQSATPNDAVVISF